MTLIFAGAALRHGAQMSVSQKDMLALLSRTDARTIAIAGCSKNAGKTTAMNVLTSTWKGGTTGLLSIGIDGEDADFWLGVPKPRIAALAGTLFATAERTLDAASCRHETVFRTGIETPLGELVIARTLESGLLLLAGVRHKEDVRNVRDRMQAEGANRVVIDGAYQRLMSADPSISDGLILATGAILGATVAEVVEKTSWFVDRLRLPEAAEPHVREALDLACSTGSTVGLLAGGTLIEGGAGADGAVRLAAAAGKSLKALALPGALPAGLSGEVAGASGSDDLTIVVRDATRIFCGATEFRRFMRDGHSIVTGRSIRLLALAVNPVSVTGSSLPSGELVEALSLAVPGVPVLDFVAAAAGRRL